MKKNILIILLALFSTLGYAQNLKITGKVTNQSDGFGIPGVSILIKGTSDGTVTDIDGNYNISASANDILVFSFIGMESQEITLNNQSVVNVVLKESTTGLEEVVVVGYGIQTKSDITGSIVGVKSDDLENTSSASPIQAIQGKLAGVQIVSSGAPGAAPMVRIRGVGTMLAGADPLYVVDGVITGDVRNINQDDILSVDVLKDASSAAIYGVRGANGVIIITTKSGKKGKMKVNYNTKVGFHKMINEVDMADSQLFAEYSNEAAAYDNQEAPYDLANLQHNTNWLDEITRTSFTQDHNLSVSGGGEKNTYFFSLGYMKDEGILKTNDYERLSLRLNNTYQINDAIKVGNNISISRFKSDNAPYSTFTTAYRAAPTVQVKDAEGNYGSTIKNNVGNPVATLDYNNDRSWGTRIQGTVFAELEVIKNLKFKSSFGVDASYNQGKVYNPVYNVNANQKNEKSSLSIGKNDSESWIWDNILSYEFKLNENHDFKVMAGVTAEKTKTNWLNGSRQDVPNDEDYWYLDAGSESSMTNGNGGDKFSRNSYIGRLNYAYANKYLLTATIRRDGSSKISKDQRWGTFPSIGLGWRISEEAFMDNFSWLDNLKLRASWGKLGNDNISSSAFIRTMAPNLNYVLGPDQAVVPGTIVRDIKDPNLKWEVTEEYDLGLEFSILNNKLTGEIDYYNKLTSDALINAPLDAIFGDTEFLTNKVDVRNEGFEVALNWREKINDELSFSVGVNMTHNINKIENVNGGLPIVSGSLENGQVTTRTEEGEEIGSFWVYQTDGIFQNQAEIDAYTNSNGEKIQANAKPGDFKYKDNNNDGVLNDDDRVYKGSYQPKLYYGINAGVNYKNFDFSIDFYGNSGNKVYNGKKAQRFGNENIEASLVDRWTPTNLSNTTPRASNNVPIASSYYVESGSYFKINNITLGYTFPKEWLSAIGFEKVRWYLSANNPKIWQDYSGYTPELPGGALNSGIELNAHPASATYLMGLNITF